MSRRDIVERHRFVRLEVDLRGWGGVARGQSRYLWRIGELR